MGYGKITPKQQEILDFLKNEILNKGYPPTVREICKAVNLCSTSSVFTHLEKLEQNGYIDFINIIYITDYFGVSFESCVFNIAYNIGKIEGDIGPKEIKTRIRKFKPDIKRMELGIKRPKM